MKTFSFYNKKENYKVVDIVLSHTLDFKKSFKNKSIRKAGDIEIYLASIDDIIQMKKNTEREQDISDIEMLTRLKEILEGEDNEGL